MTTVSPNATASHGRERHERGDGFTLAELVVVMAIIGILGVLSTTGWLRYQRAVEQRGTAQELVSALRNAQQASLAEAVTYCVSFDSAARSYTVSKFSCGSTGTMGKTATTQSPRVGLATAAFLQPDGSSAPQVSFYARGAATKGSVKVTRDGADKTYTITVEGLTGRVSLLG